MKTQLQKNMVVRRAVGALVVFWALSSVTVNSAWARPADDNYSRRHLSLPRHQLFVNATLQGWFDTDDAGAAPRRINPYRRGM